MDQCSDITAAVLVIGDEILSGRTQDTNTNTIARFLAGLGIDLKEVRVVPDQQGEIVAAVNALRARYTYVFTTGGIGPTHDDITADAMAAAFGVDIDYHPEALALLGARYKPGEFNDMRKRMARVPLGGALIRNSVSVAPGFRLENVFVMAGVPMIMRAMLEEIAPLLTRGRVVHAVTIAADTGEGQIAEGLARIQSENPDVVVGSYPLFTATGGFAVQLVVRGRDHARVEAAASAIELLLTGQGAAHRRLAAS